MGDVEPIAIVGIGCRLPGGVRSPDDLWKLLCGGLDPIVEVPEDRWYLPALYHSDSSKPARMNTRWGGFLDHIDRFDAHFFGISPREAEAADPQQRLLLEVAYHAVEDAGLTLASLAGRQASVHVGICTWDYSYIQMKAEERAALTAYSNLGISLSIAANRLSYFFNLLGPSLAVDTACSSSLVATHMACRGIWNGESDLAFVGGVNLTLVPEMTIGFSKASMLSPDGRCRSFDSRANGYVRSEGAGVVILKPLARALADRDHIYAVIRATAINQDGRTAGISAPNVIAQEANIRQALRLGDISPESVHYIEAHGTGTAVGDPIEAAAIGAVYGKARNPRERCIIGSIKSNLGHLEAAAGIAGLIKAALCLHHGKIPGNLHFENPNPQIPFEDLRLRVAQRTKSWPATNGNAPRAAVNSFGFGGTNGHAILEAAPADPLSLRSRTTSADDRAWILPLSARSAPALLDVARCYLDAFRDELYLKRQALRDISYSATVKRSHHEFRLALVAHDHAEVTDQLEAFLRGETRPNSSTDRSSGGSAKPVFVCSGMGQQWWAMGRELLTQEPIYRRVIEEVNEIFAQLAGWSLLEKLTADEKTSQIQETRFGQPAIFALQVGLAALWRSWGIAPAAVLGHSAGEMAAAYIAGALSLEDAARVTYHRSRLQFRTAGQGAMLAAGISRREAGDLVQRYAGAIDLAAVNGTNSVTLSGNAVVLTEIEKALNEAGLFSRALQVDIPFHSPKMEQIQIELLESLRNIRPQSAKIPFFSTVTGTALDGSELDAHYWYRNVRQPVLFHDVIQKIIEAGNKVFLEIGAHPILRHDLVECMTEKSSPGMTISSLRRGDRERAGLLGSLGRLYTLGAEIDWHELYPPNVSFLKLPRYPFQAETHWRESTRTRQLRLSRAVHPLLGQRLETAKPAWNVQIDVGAPDLKYLADHVIRHSVVFPGSGYVEMALAASREIFGPVPCVVEDLEFLKLLSLDQDARPLAQVVLDSSTNAFEVYVCTDASENDWVLHARGYVKTVENEVVPGNIDIGLIRQRCSEQCDKDECYRKLPPRSGSNAGPAFQGIAQLWHNDREILGEIHVPSSLEDDFCAYRLHPALLDACFQTITIHWPPSGQTFLPVSVERIRFYKNPSARVFAYSQVTKTSGLERKSDLQILDEAGDCIADFRGLTARQSGYLAQGIKSAFYEYQWRLSPRSVMREAADVNPVWPLDAMAPLLRQQAETLHRRFNRPRFQDVFHSYSRAAAAAYIGRALHELGWTQWSCRGLDVETLANRLGIEPQYHRWLRLMLCQLTDAEITSPNDPRHLWKKAWDEFPECQAELMLLRRCGEDLPAVLRGKLDPLSLIFPDGAMATAEFLYQDSPSFRLNNLLVQNVIVEIVRRLPRGKALRVLEIGGGTGSMTNFLLPVLPEHCTEYVFTDVSPQFTAHARGKFGRFPFVRYETLDIERDPLEQGFDPHSFDVIIASDVLHATSDLRKTLDRVKQLLGSGAMLVLVELTRPWLFMTLIFGLLKDWWVFEDDVRLDAPCVSQNIWKGLLHEAGFTDTVIVGDCPIPEAAQHSVILAQAPKLSASPRPPSQVPKQSRTWLLLADVGGADGRSAAAQLALELQERGESVIRVTHGKSFCHDEQASFTICPGNADDMRRLVERVSSQTPNLAGIVHLWSLDTPATELLTSEALVSTTRLGCVSAMQLLQALSAAADRLVVDTICLVTHAAQPLVNSIDTLRIAQSPLWGFGRVAMNEYKNLHFRLVDLATRCREEIAALAEELLGSADTEDEIALHRELRYVHRLVRVTATGARGMGRPNDSASDAFRIQIPRAGVLEACARKVKRRAIKPTEVELEVDAAGLNFKDLMLAMGMLPPDEAQGSDTGIWLGLECAGRVVAVGNEVARLAIGDEVVATGVNCLASHVTTDSAYVTHKPKSMHFEQAATIPVAFSTAHHSLHCLAKIQHGERILIHSAAGGVGLAAVQLSLKAGAVVFATAGSPQKRELLSAVGVPHVMDSRSMAFVDEILNFTAGEGVDVVLNSLSGEAIDKSLSILRPGGRFIEIGKSDIYNNRKIGMRLLQKNISLFTVDLMERMRAQQPGLAWPLLSEIVGKFESNDLQLSPYRVFPVTAMADALRHMAQAKHVGKLIVSMRDRAGLQIESDPHPVLIDHSATYLITGGLGGFGLAVAERLVTRGARHLALLGRSVPSPTAQNAVDRLRDRGVEVKVWSVDVSDLQQARQVIAEIKDRMGPLKGIVHTAVVWDDGAIEGLNEQRMWKAMAPKAAGAWNLHNLTLDIALDFFVLFSSLASVTGNPGQANYAAANAFLDALAYYRRARGLPALTINWGALGGVGQVARSPELAQRLERLGLTAMPVSETLDALDELISSEAVQISFADVAWKPLLQSTTSRIPSKFAELVQDPAREDGPTLRSIGHEILEANDTKLPSIENYLRGLLARVMGSSPSRIDTQQSIRDLGVDSLMALEVRNRINADLRTNVPLGKLIQSSSIDALAAYLFDRLLERRLTEGSRADLSEIEAAVTDLRADSKGHSVPLEPIEDLAEFVVGAVPPEITRVKMLSSTKLQEAATMLAKRFHDNPLSVAAVPEPTRRHKALQTFFAIHLKDAMRYGRVDMVLEEQRVVGVLISYPPEARQMSLARAVRLAPDFIRFAAFNASGALRALRIRTKLDSVRPKQPHYYACLLATLPGRQIVSASLTKTLTDLADEEGLPIYLETLERRYAELYAQVGFIVLLDNLDVLPGGPSAWTMWREKGAKHKGAIP